jgi:DNA-binding transcriptional LysR family regulator
VQGPHTWNYRNLAQACRARGLTMPKGRLVTLSISVIASFLAEGPFITAMPRSVARFRSLKILPIDLPSRPWPVSMISLRNRTLSPAADRFMEGARVFTSRLQKKSKPPS